jgi:hypothetical protein
MAAECVLSCSRRVIFRAVLHEHAVRGPTHAEFSLRNTVTTRVRGPHAPRVNGIRWVRPGRATARVSPGSRAARSTTSCSSTVFVGGDRLRSGRFSLNSGTPTTMLSKTETLRRELPDGSRRVDALASCAGSQPPILAAGLLYFHAPPGYQRRLKQNRPISLQSQTRAQR